MNRTCHFITLQRFFRAPYVKLNPSWRNKQIVVGVQLWKSKSAMHKDNLDAGRDKYLAFCTVQTRYNETLARVDGGRVAMVGIINISRTDARLRFIVHEAMHYVLSYMRMYRRAMGIEMKEEDKAIIMENVSSAAIHIIERGMKRKLEI